MKNNVIPLNALANSRQAMREKACQWVVKLSAGASDQELHEVHAWLDENPDHLKALLDVASLWDQVSVLSELSDVFPLQEYLSPRPVRARRGLICFAVAALLLVLCLQSSFLAWVDHQWSRAVHENLQLSYETRIGQQFTVVLPDGSEVLLNTNSRIIINFSARSRDITLHRGEGHFSVAKDKDRPFRVHANGGVVEAIGTAFTVQETLQDGLEVTVIEGEVNFTRIRQPVNSAVLEEAQPVAAKPAAASVASPTESISLTAGETVQVKKDDEAVQKVMIEPAELENRLAWRDGMLLFEGDPLEKVIREVSRYTSIRIDVDETVRNIPVLAYFRTGDIEGVMLTMRETFNIRVERLSADHIVLTSNN